MAEPAASAGSGLTRSLGVMIGPSYFVTTDYFKIAGREDDATNPGRYGKEFASWMSEQLRARNEVVSQVVAEDFGWCVVLGTEPARVWIACGNRDGSTNEWGAYVVAEPTLAQRLFKRSGVRAELDRLSGVVQTIMRTVPGGSEPVVDDSA